MRSSGMQASVKPWWYLFPVVYTRWHWTRHLWSLDQHSEWNGGKKEKYRKRKVSEIGFSIQPWFRCKDKPRKKQPHGILPFKGLKKENQRMLDNFRTGKFLKSTRYESKDNKDLFTITFTTATWMGNTILYYLMRTMQITQRKHMTRLKSVSWDAQS